jgi:hypothetical protein
VINEPHIYRHSPVQIILLVMTMLVLLGFVALMALSMADYSALVFFIFSVGACIFMSYSMTQKAILSEDGISTQTILEKESLRWGEISRVSGGGYGIELHNFDDDVMVAPSPQLSGYVEIVEWIGLKRPDLFDPLNHSEMKKGWRGIVSLALIVMFVAGMFVVLGIAFINMPQAPVILLLPMVLFALIFAIFFRKALFQPQSLIIDGKFLWVKSLLKENTLSAEEIASIDLSFSQNKVGKSYFILLTQTDGRKISISGLEPNLPVVYLVLKNWHKKNA